MALPGRENLPQDGLGHPARLDAGALQGGLDGDLAEIMGGQRCECPIEGADRRPCGSDDDDVVLHLGSSLWVKLSGEKGAISSGPVPMPAAC